MILICGMLLDAIFGEPRWIWSRVRHPAVIMGQIIERCDQRFNRGNMRRLTGTCVLVMLCSAAGLLGWLLETLPGPTVDILVLAVLLAQKSLVQHVQAVADALRLSLGDGRQAVAMIVGRDTKLLDQSGVARSAIESAAENLSDGVIAPIFWFALGGLPGLLIYKITNTADSMIGYRTPKHKDFGWASARLDDLLNYIPARITAILIWVTTGMGGWSKMASDAPQHRSPNAGWPEAAMAYGIDVALSGPRSYDGMMKGYPFVNSDGAKHLTPDSIDRAVTVLWRVWVAILVLAFCWNLLL